MVINIFATEYLVFTFMLNAVKTSFKNMRSDTYTKNFKFNIAEI